MKWYRFLIPVILAVASEAPAQIIADFEIGAGGFVKADSADNLGTSLSVASRILDPTHTSTGVLKLRWDFTIGDSLQRGAVVLKPAGGIPSLGARFITFWVYVPDSIPSGFTVEVFAEDIVHHTFHGDRLRGSDIPKAKWYPISMDLARASALDPNFDLSAGNIARTGILISNEGSLGTSWTDSIYADNVALVGAQPVILGNFETGLNGYTNVNFGPALKGVSRVPDPTARSTGVMKLNWVFPADSNTKGAVGLVPGGGIPVNGAEFVTYWVYFPNDTVPDTLVIDVFAQSNVSPYTYHDVGFLAGDIPKRTWFPLSMDLVQTRINDNTYDIARLLQTGIQIHSYSYLGPNPAWTDSMYVDDAAFLTYPTPPVPPKRILADFTTPGDLGAFHLLSQWPAAVSVANGVDTTNAANRILRAAFSFSDTGTVPSDSGGIGRDGVGIHSTTGDTTVSAITVDVFVPVGMPDSSIFTVAFQGSATDGKWTGDRYTLGRDIYQGQWNTLAYNVSNHLADTSITNPLGAGTFGVVVSYAPPVPEWSGQLFIDNLTLIGVRGPTLEAGQPARFSYSYKLYQNYPNPFNPSTTVRYELQRDGEVTLQVFNVLGQHITTLVHGLQEAGPHEVTFDAKGFASGVYFISIRSGSFVGIRKMLLLR